MTSKKRCRSTKATTIRAVQRLQEIFEMRLQGRTLREIGAHFGVTFQAIHSAIQRELNRVEVPSAIEMKKLELERLDKIFRTFFALTIDNADEDAAMICLNVMRRRAKLLGIEAPTRIEATGRNGEPLGSVIPVVRLVIETDKDDSSAPTVKTVT